MFQRLRLGSYCSFSSLRIVAPRRVALSPVEPPRRLKNVAQPWTPI
jgi:hypothetical protein